MIEYENPAYDGEQEYNADTIIQPDLGLDANPVSNPIPVANHVSNPIGSDLETRLPDPPLDTPSVPSIQQKRISLKLSKLDITQIDHSKLKLLENNGLAVETREGWKVLTLKDDPKKFSERPLIPEDEYQKLFKVTRKEYLKRVKKSRQKQAIEMVSLSASRLEPQPRITKTNVDDAPTEMNRGISQYLEIVRELEATGLPVREIRGLNEAARTLHGNIAIQSSRLVTVEETIRTSGQKLEEDPTNAEARAELERAESEKTVIIESLNNLREDQNSQITSVKETISKLKDERLSLWEKIKLILREQGLTISAILSTIGLLIRLIVSEANKIVGGSGSGGGGSGSGGETLKDNFVKRGLKNLATALKSLATKALVVLPGVVGSIVSTLLKSGAAVVTAFAEHIWALGLALGFVICQTFSKTEVGRRIERRKYKN